MKIGIYLLSVTIGLFLIVTLFNTLTTKSKQPEPVSTDVSLDGNRAILRFSEAITYKTVSYEDRARFEPAPFDQFIEFLKRSYTEIFNQLETERINDYALLFKWTGTDSGKKPVGLTGHYDVVPVLEGTEGDWQQDPFGGKVENGIIWGRGTLDDKIGVIGILEAVQYLLNEGFQPSRDLYFMFGFDEEIGGEMGAKVIAETLKERGVQFEFILDEGGAIVENMVPGVTNPVGVVGVSEKGFATAELSVEGSGGHSSQPSNSTNIGKIARAIAKLEETQFDGKLRGPGKDLF